MRNILIVILLYSFTAHAVPSGHWLGILKIKPMTYRIFLKYDGAAGSVYILNPKSNEIPLETLYFRNDSLFFKRSDFYSTFRGKYVPASNTIDGYWTDDGHKKHPVTFQPVNPDTLAGLRPKVSQKYQWMLPKPQNDGLEIGTPASTRTSMPLLDSLTHRIMREEYPNVHALLIARSGVLIYEEYFFGWKPDDLWLIQSATKSFTSALAGIALGSGELKDLDDPICKYLNQYRDRACNAQNQSITVRQLLTMTTGLEWNELEFDYHDQRNSANQCGRHDDPFECLLSRPKINSPDPVFSYNSVNHLMMNKILRKATSLKNEKELKQRLLDPLNIDRANTGTADNGVIGDISLTPRDMLKFGMLYLNSGRWQGKQIVPADWVKESTSSKIRINDSEGYGYFWWTKDFASKGKTVGAYYAWGYGGQYIFVLPSLDLVVVMTGSNWVMDEKKYAFEMMEAFIVQACSDL